MATDNGVFSEKVFHHDVFDTGWRNLSKWHQTRDERKEQMRQLFYEDIEITEFILAVTVSGMLMPDYSIKKIRRLMPMSEFIKLQKGKTNA